MTAADKPRSDLVALFDVFAAAAPAYSSIQMHGDAAADALLEWSLEHGHGAKIERHEQAEGRTWQAVCVDFPNRSWMTAHRATEVTAQADQQVLARVKAALERTAANCCSRCGDLMMTTSTGERCISGCAIEQPEAAEGSV